MGRRIVLISLFTFIFMMSLAYLGVLSFIEGPLGILIVIIPLIVLSISYCQVARSGNPSWE